MGATPASSTRRRCPRPTRKRPAAYPSIPAPRRDLFWSVSRSAPTARRSGRVSSRYRKTRPRPAISALYRHRRRHVRSTGMRAPVLKMAGSESRRGGHFEYRHAHTRATAMPSAMPIQLWRPRPDRSDAALGFGVAPRRSPSARAEAVVKGRSVPIESGPSDRRSCVRGGTSRSAALA